MYIVIIVFTALIIALSLIAGKQQRGEEMKDFVKDCLPVAGVGLAAGFLTGIFVYGHAD